MKRLNFDSQGKLAGFKPANEASEENEQPLILLKSPVETETFETFTPIRNDSNWSLYSNNLPLAPLRFSNGKTQEDVVMEVVKNINEGKKVIFLKGVCGTGKSAIALNIARKLGRASIVVPVKNLQKQYEEDYMKKKYVLKPNGQKLKIAMITGRENHDSIISPGISCADPFLPDTIKIIEKNSMYLKRFYSSNPFVPKDSNPDLKNLRRISIAPANPYWSPIVPAQFDLNLPDAKKKKYKGLNNQDFYFYHRKQGCSYYDQYQSYIDADVIIFNAAKYKIETSLNRKPATDVEIIDEADEFLDSFASQQSINLTRLNHALGSIMAETQETQDIINEIKELIRLEEVNKNALGVDESLIFKLSETKLSEILTLLVENPEIEDEVYVDEMNYVARVIEIAHEFKDFFSETYLTYKKDEKELYVGLVTTNLSKQFEETVNKNKALVLMSGTLHNEEIIKKVFGIKDYVIVEAETQFPGTIELCMTGKEFDCRYSNFSSKRYSKDDYLRSLSKAMEKAKTPVLVHVNAFEDLPTEADKERLGIHNLMSKEKLLDLQMNDKGDKRIAVFKAKLADTLFTTKCSRGVDFPGDTCNTIIFTKYPNPNLNETFWKVLQKTHADQFWDFYKDKAWREFLQKTYRALRSEKDHVFILSPDLRVVEAVKVLQRNKNN